MRIFAPGFLLGVCFIYCFPTAPSLIWLLPLLLATLGCFYGRRLSLFRFLLGALLGLSWLIVYLHFFVVKPLPHHLEKKKLSISGVVVGLPKRNPQYTSFLFRTSSIGQHKRLLKLNWYYPKTILRPGEHWQLTVKLKQPHGLQNPGGFDFNAWAFEQGISATGYVDAKSSSISRVASGLTQQNMNRFREYLLNQLMRALPHQPMAHFIAALTLGSRQGMTQADWQVLQRTGTSHLMAISGLHIGLVAGLMFLAISFFWRRFPRLTLMFPAQQVAAFFSLMTALVYCALAGFSLPTQRALIMLSVVLFAVLLKRRVLPWHALSSALFIILLLYPLSVLSMSFWLSFSAVAVIVYGVSGRIKPAGKFRQAINVQLVVTLGLVPLSILFFQKTSLLSPFANAVAIPWVGFIVVPLSLLGLLFLLINHALAHGVLWLAVWNMHAVWLFLQFLASLKFAAVHYTLPNVLILPFMIIGVLLLLAPRGFPVKYLSLFFFLPVFFAARQVPATNALRFTLLDVGQGLATVIQTHHHVLIYDAGPSFADMSAAKSAIIPFLRKQGIGKIDLLVISHLDNDHAGGAADLLKNLKISKVVTSDPAHFNKAKASLCEVGQHWQWDGVQFRFLFPEKKLSFKKRNNLSCVLRVSVGKQSILLTGDIEKPAELYLLKHDKKYLPSTILVAPHHGSKTSSSWAFIQAVKPRYVLFPVGYLNRFHFPSAIIDKRYQTLGVNRLSTDKTGAVSFYMSADKIQVRTYAETNKHIWSFDKGAEAGGQRLS